MAEIAVHLDDKIIAKGLKITGYKKIDRLVERALKEFIRRRSLQRLLKVKGRIHWEGDLDMLRQYGL